MSERRRDAQESDRSRAIARYAILDTAPEAEFDEVVALASAICEAPVSLITLLDTDRQWFKARVGVDLSETPIGMAICTHTVQQGDLVVIPDTAHDPRTAENPVVAGAPHVRFYAGMPLETPEGVAIGTLCVLDMVPRELTPLQRTTLKVLARQVMGQLDLRRTLRERRETDRRNTQILDCATDYAIMSMDCEGRITSWNSGAENILGWNSAEMLGARVHAVFTEADQRDRVPETEMRQARLEGRGIDERWHQRRDGSLFWAQGEMMPLHDAAGAHEGFIKILRDRTAQRREAERQRAEGEFMRSVLSASADCIKVLDLEARLTFMSEGGMRVMEVDDFAAIAGCPWPDFWVGEGNRAAIAAIADARAGRLGHFQGAADTMAGNPRWWDVQVTPIPGPDGRPERLLAVSRDITDQKAFEQQVTANEARWRSLFLGMQEGFVIGEILRDASGRAVDFRFVEMNPSFVAQTGLPADTVGRTMREAVPGVAQDLIDTYARVTETGISEQFEADVPALRRSFEIRAYKEDGSRFAALFLDITARKQGDRRRTAMVELGDRLRDVGDRAEIAAIAAEILGRTLGLTRAGLGAVDLASETITVMRDWSVPGLHSLAGRIGFRAYGSFVDALKAGETVLIQDVRTDPRTAAGSEAFAALGVRALANLPLMEHGRFVTLFFALTAEPHAFTPEEVGFLRNVAERTRAAIARIEAEEQQRVLNQELGHRMKNMLAMVQAIATQTMRNAQDVKTAGDVLAGRLIALGQAHDILLGGALGSTALRGLIVGATRLHEDRPGRILIEGPDLAIGSKAALSLSLVLHELATNAVKYGALSARSGVVEISWRVAPGDGGEVFDFVWSERGGPVVAPPTRRGFGTRLISRGLAGSSPGGVDVSYRPEGLRVTISAALSSLQE